MLTDIRALADHFLMAFPNINNIHLSQSLESHIYSVELFVRILDFELHFPKTLSNAKMVNISNVDLD